ncbi:MAG: phosphate ABC transporter substrate-binding protein PstS [Epsilonproteobacteria bacterium]|nr:phosphate ABC transporter substrate-binding protein PstS [Campylobacterota bacterium]
MKKILSMTLALSVSALAWTINGTGASFPYPVYKETIKQFYSKTQNRVNYSPTGSGTGIKEVAKRHVDFGGSDKPLKPTTLKKAKLYMFPTIVGGIAMAYNIPSVSNLKLSQAAIEGIVLGKIKYWDNPLIAQTNAHLPHKKIIFVHRSDKSGTTFNFTYYLSKMSKTWRHKYGARKTISWPTDAQGRGIAGKGNFGVSAAIKTNPYSIGYVDYADALKNHLKMAVVQAADGTYSAPTPQNFAKGAAYAGFSAKNNFYRIIAYPQKGYPIIAATFVLLPAEKVQTDKKVTQFFDYLYNHDEIASKLGYVPLPTNVKTQVREYWAKKGIK